MFSYTVTFFDSIERKTMTEKGLLAAADYSTAATKLVSYYGKDYLITMTLTEVEDILSKDAIMEEFEFEED